MAKQAQFYLGIRDALRAARADGSAVWGLFAISFLYGAFHAAGPGHGKAVISSYVVANEETWRRGVILSFASALLQAMVAIGLVGIAAVLLGATAATMTETVRVIEIASYALIAAVGARLLWVKGGAFLAALRSLTARPALAVTSAGMAAVPVDHYHHDHVHDHRHAEHDHAHGPEPRDLAGPGGWRRGLAAIVAVGLRPCSGAILVLAFSLAQGLFWAGIVSTLIMGLGTAITVAVIATVAAGAKGIAMRIASARSGFGALALRGIEVAAAALVLAFGVLLLLGYMATERLLGV
jgi:ABC-type nickel/cobalt efflux system permease component RcnA